MNFMVAYSRIERVRGKEQGARSKGAEFFFVSGVRSKAT